MIANTSAFDILRCDDPTKHPGGRDRRRRREAARLRTSRCPIPKLCCPKHDASTPCSRCRTSANAWSNSLPPASLRWHLPERLSDAIAVARKLTGHEARRRQMQYVGRLMREVDPAPIEAELVRWTHAPNAEKARLVTVERWRERLLSEAGALDAFARDTAPDRSRCTAIIDRARRGRARARHASTRLPRAVPSAQFAVRSKTVSDASLRIGLVSISDRASAGVYADQGVPGLRGWFEAALESAWELGDAAHSRRAAPHRSAR